ncbi:hypothetical protein M2272_002100 [Mycobacterium frederiksbergense]|uniref:Uncharacterized protein n=1 Tax=Mycolicibacterium frederiksbergense TaxID=117567 RepID=A0ABT6KZK7_9MYCO|nr:hypothetical protein [Mycolicibacterium frederiksbergense]
MCSWVTQPPAWAAAVAARSGGNGSPVTDTRGPRFTASRYRRRASSAEIRNRIRRASGQDFAPIRAGVFCSANAATAGCSIVGNRLRASCTPAHTSNNSAADIEAKDSSRRSAIAAANAASLAPTRSCIIRTYIRLPTSSPEFGAVPCRCG